MKTRAILVAGGKGSRLYPFTHYTQKTLLPLFDRPVIDYALGTIRRGGITRTTIISNEHIGQIAKHVGQSLEGEQIHYVLEEEPQGVAQALLLARPHNENCRLMIYFSDNITTVEFEQLVQEFSEAENPPGCLLLAREEENPQAFGVAVLGDDGRIVDVVEKPENPPPILLLVEFISSMKPFGTNSIALLKKRAMPSQYLISIGPTSLKEKAEFISVGAETWVDCGTPETLLQASIMAREGKLNPRPFRER